MFSIYLFILIIIYLPFAYTLHDIKQAFREPFRKSKTVKMVSHQEVMKLLSKQAKYDGGALLGGSLIGGRVIGGCCECGGTLIGGCAMCGLAPDLGAQLKRMRVPKRGGARRTRPGAQARAQGLKAYAARHGVTYKQAMIAAKGFDVTPDGLLVEKPPKPPKEPKQPRAPRIPREKKPSQAAERRQLMALLKDAGKQAIGCPPYGRLTDLEKIRDNISYARALADPAVVDLVESMKKPLGLGRRPSDLLGRKPRDRAKQSYARSGPYVF